MVNDLCPSDCHPGGAYEIIKRLQAKGENDLLLTLQNNVEEKRRANNKLHDVWKISFDWKYCKSHAFIKQKLNYMPARRVIQVGMIISATVNEIMQ